MSFVLPDVRPSLPDRHPRVWFLFRILSCTDTEICEKESRGSSDHRVGHGDSLFTLLEEPPLVEHGNSLIP